MFSPNWMSVVLSQAGMLPYLLAYLCGIVLAIAFWQRHPMVSLLAMLGFGILLGTALLGLAMNVWLMSDPSGRGADRMRIFTAFNILRSLASAGAYGLVLAAIFGWRSPDKGF